MTKNNTQIRLVAPAEDYESAFEITPETAVVIRDMVDRLGLIRNDQDGKLYISVPARPTPAPEPVTSGSSLLYPSGVYLDRHMENNSSKYAPGNPVSAAPLVKGSYKTKLSKHFSLGEFAPKNETYTGVRVHPDLIVALEKIRSRVGATIHVTSGYRPPAYNRAAGGVPNSQHLDGLAADIYCDVLNTSQLYDIVDEVIRDGGGVGFYPVKQFVHLDVRGYRSRW